MKIIHITPSYKPAYIYGGTITSIALLCETLVKAGTEIEVWTTTANGKTELPISGNNLKKIEGVSVRRFHRMIGDHIHLSPSLLLHAFKHISNRDNVVIHIHSWWNLTAILSCIIVKIKRVPIILSPRGMLSTYSFNNRNSRFKSMIHWLIGRRLLNYVHMHATSEQEKQDILKIHQGEIEVIPNLLNNPLLNKDQQPTTQSKYFRLLYLGRIEQKKGLEKLFQALREAPFYWTLNIAGSGNAQYIDKLKDLINKLNISANVKWIGQVSDGDKYALLARHQLLVLFSYNENFANAVAESLSVGTAVAISDQVGLSPFVRHHDLGWVSDLTVTGITNALTQAQSDEQKRTRIRQNAPAMISNYLSSQILQQRYHNFYSRCI